MFAEALQAAEHGERERARDLLTRLLKADPSRTDYWVWMSVVVDTQKERGYCLNEALRMDQQNPAARRGLSILGILPPDPALALPSGLQKRAWQKALLPEESAIPASAPRWQYALMGAALLVLMFVGGLLIFGKQLQRSRVTTPAVVSQYLPTATMPESTVEVTLTALVPRSNEPAPLWMLLKATYTPTPLYVKTPHPASESFSIGMRAYHNREWDKALTYLQQSERDLTGAVDVTYYLGEVYRQQGRYREAIAHYDAVLQKQPEFAAAYLGRARARLAENPEALNEPLRDLQSALKADPGLYEAALEMALIQSQGQEPREALDTLAEAAESLPGSPAVSLYLARIYMTLNEPDLAVENARQALDLDITLLPAYRVLGEALQASGKLRGSLEPLSTYLLYEPEDAGAWRMLSAAYQSRGDTPAALDALEEALRIDSHMPAALLARGEIYLALEQPEDALKDFQAVFQTDPTSFSASLGIGKALMGLEYPGDAWEQFEQTRALAKDQLQQTEALLWRAQSLEALGEAQAALRDWKSLLEAPDDQLPSSWISLAKRHVAALVTVTPTQRPKTATVTARPTSTRWPTQTPTPTITRKPTRTQTQTPSPTRTPTPTRTRTATRKP